MLLTKNFTLNEFEISQSASRAGIDNAIPPEFIDNIKKTALNLQILRSYINLPVVITSGYRCKELNLIVGGAENSHHMTGHAVDIIVPGMAIDDIIELARDCLLFDQLINEYGQWVHLSFHPNMRGEVIRL